MISVDTRRRFNGNTTSYDFARSLSYRSYVFRNNFILRNTYRSSRSEVFCKKGVLRSFAKFIGKHLCQILFFNKIVGLRPANLFKKRFWYRYFPVNFLKFQRTPFLTEHLRWLLLEVIQKSFMPFLISWTIYHLSPHIIQKLCFPL